jgi:glycosyltransferase involved in cell wall biosynthesis
MRIAIVNDVWSPDAPTPEATLQLFTTLTGWCEGVAAQGATVTAFQRFHTGATLSRGTVTYRFVADAGPPRPSPTFGGADTLHDALAEFRPAIVHVNGFDFPLSLRRLRSRLPGECALVVQDHGGFDPDRLSRLRKAWFRYGLGAVDAILVATPPQIELFRDSRIVPAQVRIRDVMESSTNLRPAKQHVDGGALSLLWVGRLNENKDPLTVASGFSRFVRMHSHATLTFIYQQAHLEPRLRTFVEADEALRRSVTLRGFVPHGQLAEAYAEADLFVLGSHHEGSGYAVLEALACGVPPVVTDIPAFRWLTAGGTVGALWTAGDSESCCAALTRAAARPLDAQREACRQRFDGQFSWDAIGRRACAIYEELSPT